LADVNGQQPSLRRYVEGPRAENSTGGKGKGKEVEREVKEVTKEEERRVRRNKVEKERREREWDQLNRIGRLFKAPRLGWTKKEVLTLGKIISLIQLIVYQIRSSRSLPSPRSNGIQRRRNSGPPVKTSRT
jgi:hypothetical protein